MSKKAACTSACTEHGMSIFVAKRDGFVCQKCGRVVPSGRKEQLDRVAVEMLRRLEEKANL